ncbi:hypothetical protein C808_04489 [Lachnospiraceae bacterium M18-1]|nr:hypothetical protein C808_04489 [Lachnospiraceae bacterium M18-1]
MDTKSIPAVELDHITKRFAKVLANDDVSITVNKGEVVALLGENGAGKSTIMKILYGLYHATSGEIRIDGRKERIDSPKDAVKKGISMIQQHFSLVPAHTVTENIILGNCRGVIDYKAKEKEIQELADKYNFKVSASSYIKELPVGSQQKVEILKALYLNARILIMDEPTAVLTPQESEILMEFIRDYAARGNSVVFITHKMKEVMEVSDRIVVMRSGRVTGTLKKSETNETELAHTMIGHELKEIKASGDTAYESGRKRLRVKNLSVKFHNEVPLLSDIDFDIHEGEIFGVAGVSGNGQQELCEAVYGYLKPAQGTVELDGEDITHLDVRNHISRGIGYLASDRHRYGMIADMSLSENMLLKSSYLPGWSSRGMIHWRRLEEYTEKAIKEYTVKAPDHSVTAGSLSGGNQQKIVVAREVDAGRKLIIIDQPTRGLDIGAIHYVHQTILNEKAKGKSILLVSTELSEIFALSDRIAVLYKGRIMGIYRNGDLTTEQIGLLMAGCRIEKDTDVHFSGRREEEIE